MNKHVCLVQDISMVIGMCNNTRAALYYILSLEAVFRLLFSKAVWLCTE